jgi:hypothetical protein
LYNEIFFTIDFARYAARTPMYCNTMIPRNDAGALLIPAKISTRNDFR